MVRRAHRLPLGGCRHAPVELGRLHAQSPAQVTASFLVKDLHVDWRLGEHYLARELTDYDLAANNGDGNGRHRPAAMRNPTFGSSTRSRNPRSSTPAGTSSENTYRSLPRCPRNTFTRLGPCRNKSRRAPTCALGATILCRSWIMVRRARSRSSFTGASSNRNAICARTPA